MSLQEFIQEVAMAHMKMTREDAEHVGGQIFLSGSHKLGNLIVTYILLVTHVVI